jgi:hypothetical protein
MAHLANEFKNRSRMMVSFAVCGERPSHPAADQRDELAF